jgi:hypothetical protein
MRADDELHDVLVLVCGNRAVAATIERYTPLIRRLERPAQRSGQPAAADGRAAQGTRALDRGARTPFTPARD